MTSAYTRVTYHGHTLNNRTKAMLQQVEQYLGYQLTIIQGSYNHGVGASAGTHDGGGAVDLAPADHENKVRALRQVGFAAWHRTPIPGVWSEHIHCIAIKDKQMSPAAAKQIQDYYNHQDGLADHRHDSTWRPNVICSFQYPLLPVDYSSVVKQAKRKEPDHAWDSVKRIQRALNTKTGTHLVVDGLYGPVTQAAYGRYEKQIGFDKSGDGIPSKLGLIKLGLALYKVRD